MRTLIVMDDELRDYVQSQVAREAGLPEWEYGRADAKLARERMRVAFRQAPASADAAPESVVSHGLSHDTLTCSVSALSSR